MPNPLDTVVKPSHTRRMSKHHTAFWLSDRAKRLLAELAEHLGLSQAGALELAIRRLAQAELDPQQKEAKS
jgi:hypothetical protein